MKLLILQLSPTSCHFILLQSKYSPQHPVPEHPLHAGFFLGLLFNPEDGDMVFLQNIV
jgi:hypothetical protein